jgi:hypothetical protein
MKVTLTKEQIARGTEIGKKRQDYNDSINKKHAYGFKGNGHEIHVQGAISELAVAYVFNQEWSGFKEDYQKIKADVGTIFQVRSTTHSSGNLILHPKDADDQVYLLVRLHALPEVEIVGWVFGRDAKLPKYWEDGTNRPQFKGRACYLFPYEQLKPVKELMQLKISEVKSKKE